MELQQLFDLHGHTALVTGSSRGIGRAIALALAQAGANIIVHGSHPSTQLADALTEIKQYCPHAISVTADIADADALHAMLNTGYAEFGPLDILVLNASAQAYQSLMDFTTDEFMRQYSANVASAFTLMQAVLPSMQERGWGRILTIGSVNQWKPSPRLPIYASTKAAVANLVANCARQYSSYGITVNNLAPGVIRTDRNREALQDESLCATLLQSIPAGRFGTVEDCAGLAVLLCSNAGSYITGTDIPVAGGMQL